MNDRDDIAWSQIYRPRTVADCILPDRLKKPFQSYVDNKAIPSFTLTGNAGCGKTTIAVAMCEEVGCDYLVINGSSQRGIDMLRDTVTSYATTVSMFGGRKVIIIDEADGLTPDAQGALRAVMESVSKNCSFILTCNFKSKLIDPLLSRAPVIDFRLIGNEPPEMAMKFLERIKEILKSENITYESEAVLIEVVKKFFPDYRKTLTMLQLYAAQSGNEIKSDILSENMEKPINDLLGFMRDKKFRKMRQWVAKYATDSSNVFRSLFDVADSKFTPNTFADVILIVGEYQYRSYFVVDQEINLTSCLVEIMKKCELR